MGTKTVQELQNQRIVDAAIKYTPEGNNGHHLYEYGSAKHRENMVVQNIENIRV